MIGFLLLLFIAVPIIELALLIKVGQLVGVLNTISLVILTGIIGAFLARREGLKTLFGIQRDLDLGILPSNRIVDGFLIFCGGLLLLTPGLVTDLIGFFLLVPQTRGVAREWIIYQLRNKIEKGNITFFTPPR